MSNVKAPVVGEEADLLLLWLTVGLGAGVGGSGIGRGVVAVRCPACAAEQRPKGQQAHASNRDPNTSSGQYVQGIMHPQVHPGPAHQDGVADRYGGQRPDQERHERDDYRHGDGGVAGGKARAVRRLLAQHRVSHHLVGPGAVGNGLRHVRQHPCSAGRYRCGGYRQDASVSGHGVNDGEHDDSDDACRQEQMRQRRKYRGDSWRDLVEYPEQARIPAGRPRFDQQRRGAEEHYPETSQEPGGPCRRNPGRVVRPPPRCG
jgi:hypothetical protein